MVLYNNCIGWFCEKPETDFRNGLMLSKFVQPETDSNSEGTFVSQYTLWHPYTCTCNGVNTYILFICTESL